MSVSLGSYLARSTRYGGSCAAQASFLSARSVTRLQRSRPLNYRSPVVWTLGGARSFSWNPWGGAKKDVQQAIEDPVSNTQVELEQNVNAVESSASQTPIGSSSLVQTDASSTVDTGVTNTLSETVSDSIAEVVTKLGTTPIPTQYGDMAALGLVGWTPAGFFPWLLEVTQVSTGLPWWSVIILTTVGARFALLPLIIRTNRMQGRLAPIQPVLADLRKKAEQAKVEGDKFALQQAMQQQMAVMKKAGINPLDQILTGVSQVCVQLGFFIGLRRMCSAPVEQLTVGGFGWVTDLTVADPYYVTPVVNFALINLQLWVSQRDMLAVGSPAAPHILNGLRVFSAIGLPFLLYFPAGLNIHLITSIAFISLQTLTLRIPAIRKRLSLAPLPPVDKSKLPTARDTLRYLKDWYKGRMLEAQVVEQERRRKMRMAMRTPPRK